MYAFFLRENAEFGVDFQRGLCPATVKIAFVTNSPGKGSIESQEGERTVYIKIEESMGWRFSEETSTANLLLLCATFLLITLDLPAASFCSSSRRTSNPGIHSRSGMA